MIPHHKRRGEVREGTARKTLLDRSSPLRQRTADAETALSRSPGAGLVVQMRENSGLALIRPVEASALLSGASNEPADWRLYEDEIRSVEGPDAKRAAREGTALTTCRIPRGRQGNAPRPPAGD